MLARLRGLVPDYEIGYQHVLRIVERQADALLRAFDSSDPLAATPNEIIRLFPRVKVLYCDDGDLTTSGVSRWNGANWVIFLRASDCHVRQRFTLMHELAHVVHHGFDERLFTGKRWLREEPSDQAQKAEAERQRERAADHFAGCLLMPRTSVLTLWASGVTDASELAAHFDVSKAAMQVRLEQLELVRPRWACSRGASDAATVRAYSHKTEADVQRLRALGLREPGRHIRLGRKQGRPWVRETRSRRILLHHQDLGGVT